VQLQAVLQEQLSVADAVLRPGCTIEDARLAACMVGAAKGPAFAADLAKLRTMGFAADVVCGALLATNGDVEAALDRHLTI
jgi:hypothetical protein